MLPQPLFHLVTDRARAVADHNKSGRPNLCHVQAFQNNLSTYRREFSSCFMSSRSTWWSSMHGVAGNKTHRFLCQFAVSLNAFFGISCERSCIATGQHSSLCVSAVVLILGGSDDMEVDEQDREQVDSERESRGAWEKGRRQHKETTTLRRSECGRCDTLSHNVMCAQGQICREKGSCEVYLSACRPHRSSKHWSLPTIIFFRLVFSFISYVVVHFFGPLGFGLHRPGINLGFSLRAAKIQLIHWRRWIFEVDFFFAVVSTWVQCFCPAMLKKSSPWTDMNNLSFLCT